jgi:D-alanyl-D-alanine carboxypeptidase
MGRVNRLADDLGAVDTNFEVPTGFTNSDNHYTTVWDLAKMAAGIESKYYTFIRDNAGRESLEFGRIAIPFTNVATPSPIRHTSALIRDRSERVAEGHTPVDWAKTGSLRCSGRTLVAVSMINNQVVVSVESGFPFDGYSGRDNIIQDNMDMARARIQGGVAPLIMVSTPIEGGGVRMTWSANAPMPVVNASTNQTIKPITLPEPIM